MITTTELAWAAGFLEGEGSFLRKVRGIAVTAAQTQLAPLEKLQGILGGTISLWRPSKNPRHQDVHLWQISGAGAAGVMMTLYQWMSPRRRAAILKALAYWKTIPKDFHLRTHCPAGHEYAGSNLIVQRDSRRGRTQSRKCRECRRQAGERYRRKAA